MGRVTVPRAGPEKVAMSRPVHVNAVGKEFVLKAPVNVMKDTVGVDASYGFAQDNVMDTGSAKD